jgi:hypothetical protein
MGNDNRQNMSEYEYGNTQSSTYQSVVLVIMKVTISSNTNIFLNLGRPFASDCQKLRPWREAALLEARALRSTFICNLIDFHWSIDTGGPIASCFAWLRTMQLPTGTFPGRGERASVKGPHPIRAPRLPQEWPERTHAVTSPYPFRHAYVFAWIRSRNKKRKEEKERKRRKERNSARAWRRPLV